MTWTQSSKMSQELWNPPSSLLCSFLHAHLPQWAASETACAGLVSCKPYVLHQWDLPTHFASSEGAPEDTLLSSEFFGQSTFCGKLLWTSLKCTVFTTPGTCAAGEFPSQTQEGLFWARKGRTFYGLLNHFSLIQWAATAPWIFFPIAQKQDGY